MKMLSPTTQVPLARASIFTRFLDKVEHWGNKLPDPVIMFMALCVMILLASTLFSLIGTAVENPISGETIEVVNLLTIDGIVRIFAEATHNFTSFPALGIVLVVMLGIGIAEHSGYFKALMVSAVQRAPLKVIMPVIILVAMLGTIAGDASQIVVPPIAAMVFLRLGYHPIAGLVMAYAAALGAFAANVLIGMSDALSLAFTESALLMMGSDIKVNIAMNWYFMSASMFLLLGVILLVTYKITIPRLGHYDETQISHADNETAMDALSFNEQHGLKWANRTVVFIVLSITIMALPESSFLRNPDTHGLIDGPLIDGISMIITMLFFIPGIVYAVVAKKVKSSKEIVAMMNDAMCGMGAFIVIVFFSAQMIAFFNWSNLGAVIAIKGAELLEGQHGVVLILGFILLTSIVNIFMGSASAKWALLAPIFVPMFMMLGYHPAFTQMLYRVGDSITNPITPMLAYLPLLLSFARRYDKNIGLGTLMASLFPYTIALGIVWTLFVLFWYWLGIPSGPGSPIYL